MSDIQVMSLAVLEEIVEINVSGFIPSVGLLSYIFIKPGILSIIEVLA